MRSIPAARAAFASWSVVPPPKRSAVLFRVDALCTHPGIAAVSFVGSSGVAAHVYALASGSPQNNPVVPTANEIVAPYEEAW